MGPKLYINLHIDKSFVNCFIPPNMVKISLMASFVVIVGEGPAMELGVSGFQADDDAMVARIAPVDVNAFMAGSAGVENACTFVRG